MSKVTIELETKDAESVRAWQRVRKGIEEFNQELDQIKGKNQQNASSAERFFQRQASGFLSMTVGALSVQSVLQGIIDKQSEMIQKADEAGLKADVQRRKFQVQSGLDELGTKAARARIQAIANKEAIPFEQANTAAVQLVSSGFTAEEGSGAALQTLLEGLQASNLGDVDPQLLAQAAGQFLEAQGLEKNAKNLKRVLVAVQRMFKGTDLQLSDLTNLAGKSEAFAGYLSPEETLGVFDILRSRNNPDVAATAEKIIISRLQTAAATKETKDALAMAGIKPEEVDLVGESIGDVLDVLAVRMGKLSEERQNVLLKKLFGDEAVAPARGLIRDRAKLPGLIADMGDVAGYEKDVETATSGAAAGKVRQENAREQQFGEKYTDQSLIIDEAELMMREQGVSEFWISLARKRAELRRMMGETSDDYLAQPFGLSGEDVRQRLEQRQGGAGRQVGPDFSRPAKGERPDRDGGETEDTSADGMETASLENALRELTKELKQQRSTERAERPIEVAVNVDDRGRGRSIGRPTGRRRAEALDAREVLS